MKNRSLKQRLISALLVLVMMITSLLGTTFAWFTDEVTSAGNKIETGSLKVDLLHKVDENWVSLKDNPDHKVFDYDKWEPGYTTVEALKVANLGSLALRYRLSIEVADGTAATGKNGEDLADVIDVYVMYGESTAKFLDEITANNAWVHKGTLAEVMKNPASFMGGQLLPTGEVLDENAASTTAVGSQIVKIALHMQESAGNEYQKLSVGDIYVNLVATQWSYEDDSFGNDYDNGATFPSFSGDYVATAPVEVNGDNTVKNEVTLSSKENEVSATVPSGTLLEAGVNNVTLTVSSLKNSDSNIEVSENQVLSAVDVHVSGIAAGNTAPILVTVKELLAKGLNMGNYELYHVENGATVAMTYVATASELDTHNEFTYDPATGDVVMALCSFSEIALLIADTANPWNGTIADGFASGTGTESDPYIIANADQLAYFGAVVGGMKGDENGKTFEGEYVKLIADINLGDKESENSSDILFYPIGYYSSDKTYEKTGIAITSGLRSFSGTFDGNGNTIANFYHNTWEMKGDNEYYAASEQCYRDGMGLFGKVYKGIVKNLTVKNFSSDGEYTTTGVIAAYADGATFENIAIFDCNPRVYNIGNGGIVGCVGWYAQEADLPTTFTNITVDNSNKISALWGSWDVACGGIVGQYYPTSGQSSAGKPANGGVHFDNCHVAAQMDVYNDVCANYQYYAYRYTGMLIGSVRENLPADANGHVYPKMDGITASGCTVHFGDWNDYYYCELVANSLASYTHDHQFSRLEQVASVDTDNITVTTLKGETVAIPSSGRVNYVVVNVKNGDKFVHATENATCYHFVDGKAHSHDDYNDDGVADYETVNGESILVENNRHIYLEFNNLVTGYGWGVTTKGVGDMDGVTILDREVGDSVQKFEGKVSELSNGTKIKIGDIFDLIDDNTVDLVAEALTVSVVSLDENNPITAVFTRDINDWTNGTLLITGSGRAKITIQDYYFCTPTVIEVNIKEREQEKKFDAKLEGDFLYRVGNQNAVKFGSLFEALTANINADGITISVENISGTADGTEALNSATVWTDRTVRFEGTGVVKVTITDNDYCIATEVLLEIIDATNVAEDGKISSYNVSSVLLGNTSINTLYLNGGATLYGNGFTIDCTGSPITGSGSVSENYIVALVDANLDNVKIVGAVYTTYGAQASNDYNRALVVSKGNSTITNSYLSNTASPIRLVEGNLYVKGTTVKGGNFANIDVRNGHLTVEDVTTINQALGNDEATDGTTVIGLGIVVYYENVDASLTSVTIKGNLTQYNHISSNDEFSNSYANTFVSAMMSSQFSDYQTKIGSTTWVNTGVIVMTSNITPVYDGYIGSNISFQSKDGYVLSAKPTEQSLSDAPEEYETFGQGAIAPEYSFDYTNKNYIAKTDGSNDYCYYENGRVLVAMDEGDTFEWDPFILTATKFGQSLSYTVTMNGKTCAAGEKISFNTSGEYVVTYTYTDGYNYILKDGELTTNSLTYEKTVTISVSVIKPSAKHAEFTFGSSNTATEKITVNDRTYISAKGVSATDKQWGYITVNGTNIFYPIIDAKAKVSSSLSGKELQVFYPVFSGVSITDYSNGGSGAEVYYTSESTNLPSNLLVINGAEIKYTAITSACVNISSLTKDGPSGEVWDFSASSTLSTTTTYDGVLCYQSPSGLAVKSGSTRDYDMITIAQFSYEDEAGTTYYYFVGYYLPSQAESENSGGCVTPDTLITLADGTQVSVSSLTGAEELLVWNMETGKLDKAPIMFVDSDPMSEYQVVKLCFSDGTEVEVIYEHGFWDYDLNKYVYLDEDAGDYIGHTFAKQNGDSLAKVQLVDVVIKTKFTEAWSPVTAGHLSYFVNGMLSMPGGVGGLFNIFEVDPETMTYDYEQMAKDIETYGLYTYEELNALCPLSEKMFNEAGGAYLKISIGKGNLTEEELIYMIERYSKFFE